MIGNIKAYLTTNNATLKPRMVIVFGMSLILGIVIPLVLPVGSFILSGLSTFFLTFILLVITGLVWLEFGADKRLLLIMILSFVLRVALGVFLTWALPRFGYPEEVQQGGYFYADAFARDSQAWQLAQSELSIVSAFTDEFISDQYGGLLAISALVYRLFSPNFHRSYLIIILSAGIFTLGIPFFYALVKRLFDTKVSLIATWILMLYPESLLLGASQMREPFLLSFSSVLFWSAVTIIENRKRWRCWFAFAVGALGLLLISTRVAMPVFAVIFVTVWLMKYSSIKIKWQRNVGWLILFFLSIVIIALSFNWLRSGANWYVYKSILDSGWLVYLFESLPGWVSFPFVTIYGVLQPVLPAAIAAPAPWIWRVAGIFRGLGWYAILPILIYAFMRVWKAKPINTRKLLIWFNIIAWVWIFVSSVRAGGDQWDNPRYRTIFLPWMAIICAWAIAWVREHKDPWLLRWLVVELIALVFFSNWYLSRYYDWFERLPFWHMIIYILVLSAFVLLGGWLLDKRKKRS